MHAYVDLTGNDNANGYASGGSEYDNTNFQKTNGNCMKRKIWIDQIINQLFHP